MVATFAAAAIGDVDNSTDLVIVAALVPSFHSRTNKDIKFIFFCYFCKRLMSFFHHITSASLDSYKFFLLPPIRDDSKYSGL